MERSKEGEKGDFKKNHSNSELEETLKITQIITKKNETACDWMPPLFQVCVHILLSPS